MKVDSPEDPPSDDGFRFFDLQSNWDQVATILALPEVRESYEIVMRYICRKRGLEWNPIRLPIEYGDPSPRQLSSHPANQYRCFGECQTYNTLAGIIGENIAPALLWRVVVPLKWTPQSHVVAIGCKEVIKQGTFELLRSPTLMIDLIWAPDEPMDEQMQYDHAQGLLAYVQSDGAVEPRTISHCLTMMRSALDDEVA